MTDSWWVERSFIHIHQHLTFCRKNVNSTYFCPSPLLNALGRDLRLYSHVSVFVFPHLWICICAAQTKEHHCSGNRVKPVQFKCWKKYLFVKCIQSNSHHFEIPLHFLGAKSEASADLCRVQVLVHKAGEERNHIFLKREQISSFSFLLSCVGKSEWICI